MYENFFFSYGLLDIEIKNDSSPSREVAQVGPWWRLIKVSWILLCLDQIVFIYTIILKLKYV